MSLATACPACSTVFRVVQDQLKVSEGWVRCGNCHKVFNAIEHLFDLDSRRAISGTPVRRPVADSSLNARQPEAAAPVDETPVSEAPAFAPPMPAEDTPESAPDWSAAAADPAAEPANAPIETAPDGDNPPASAEPAADDSGVTDDPVPDSTDNPPTDPLTADPDPDTANSPAEATEADPVDAAAVDPDPLAPIHPIEPPSADALMQEVPRDSIQAVGQIGMPQVLNRPDADSGDASPAAATALPGFVRDADRRARWQRPWVRAVLLLLSLLLLATLLGQIAYRLRDQIAARWPQSLPLLQQACLELDCRIEPLRLIDAIVVDNTALTRPPGIDAYRLAVVLRNRAEHAVAAPHLELSLTDTTGAVVARRVFSPADFGIRERALAGQADSTWTLAFQTGGPAITGYTVSTFYP
ncbi:MAG: hypothetical protein RJA44_1676 [Pseudomonadota bacterium]